MNKITLVLFRPGTLGDQIVLHGSLSAFDLKLVDLILIEKVNICASNREFFNKFKFVYSYKSFLSLFVLCLKLSFKYRRPFFLNLTHSRKSYLRIISDWFFFNIFFKYSFAAMYTFLIYRWRRYRCVSEYKRVFSIINTLLFLDNKLSTSPPKIRNNLQPIKPLNIGFVPFSAWTSKDWPLDYSVNLIKELSSDGHNISLIGNDKLTESLKNNNIISSMNISILINLKLNELAEFMKSMDLIISMDTSMVHMSVLYSLPTVVVMSDVNRQEDWLPPHKNIIALRKYVSCGGCFSKICINKEHTCMNQITPKDVYSAANDLLLKFSS